MGDIILENNENKDTGYVLSVKEVR